LVDFPEIVSALDRFPGLSSGEAGDRLYDLFQRQAQAVEAVIAEAVTRHSRALFRNELPTGSLLAICFSRGHVETTPASDYDAQTKAFIDRLSAPVIEFAIDAGGQRVLFRGGLALDGANYRFVDALLEDFRTAKAKDAEVPFVPAPTVADALGIDEQSMRQQLRRLRKAIDPLAVSLGVVLDQDSFIETKERSGYRLNPMLRETTMADIKAEPPVR
jgi:hypothetical protein